jgi:peptidoglycan/xylan/chitin deacetylase (PgdA/CDA1 family)
MKQTLARVVHGISMRSGWSLRKARQVGLPRVLMYHAIGPQGVDAALFAWQLALLRREFEVLSLPVLLERFERGQSTGREVAITFDDGVRNHLSAAYPLLRAAGVPATFFVCPGLIETGAWIWNMALRARLRALTLADRLALAGRLHWPSDEVEGVIAYAKTLSLAERGQLEQAVREATPQFAASAEQLDLFSPLSWQELGSLDPELITVGSHTIAHPILTTLTSAEQAHEIGVSRQLLEQRLGREVPLFCYPNGGNDAAVRELARRHYRWAVTTEEDFLRPGMDRCGLPRVPAGERRALFLQRLHKPSS